MNNHEVRHGGACSKAKKFYLSMTRFIEIVRRCGVPGNGNLAQTLCVGNKRYGHKFCVFDKLSPQRQTRGPSPVAALVQNMGNECDIILAWSLNPPGPVSWIRLWKA